MNERITQPLSTGQAIKEIFANYGGVFKSIFWLVTLMSVVAIVGSLFVPLIFGLRSHNPVSVYTLLGTISFFTLLAIISFFFYGWMLDYANNYLMQEPRDYKASMKVATKRFLPLIGGLFLYFLLAGIFYFLAFGVIRVGQGHHFDWLLVVIVVLIVLAILLLPMFLAPAIVLDGMSPLKSMIYSAKLVWKNWLHVLLVLLVLVIAVFLLNFIGGFFIGFFGALFKNNPLVPLLVNIAVQFLLLILTYPLIISATLILYHELKARERITGAAS